MFSESLRLVRADNGRMFELASEWFAERSASRCNRRVGRYTDRILVLTACIWESVFPFGNKKEWYRGDFWSFVSYQRDEGLFLLPITHPNQAYKRTKDKVKEKTHAEFLRRNYQ